ncbi:MAG: cation diffusion facilitator family transporter [Alphaproteobacteria bacterium]|nr:cation diffusion facilitator family transporter [Alphaproteobacteria bacterium]
MSGPVTAARRGVLTSRAAMASVSVALLLLSFKGYAAWATGSVAMLGSLADTGLDFVASLVALFGVRFAAMPADRLHRFGHGKAEALVAMFQVVLIIFSAFGIAWRAIDRIGSAQTTGNAEYGIGVSLIAITATFALLAYQRHVIRQTQSLAIGTDHLHYKSDLMLNLSVIVALVLDQYLGFAGADALFGIAIALWLGWGALRASSNAVDQLMDKEWPLERRQRFIEVAGHHPLVAGIHDLRTRTSGMHDFAQFHIWVSPQMSIQEAHRVMDEIEARLHPEFPGVEILIHPDPEGHVDGEGDPLLAKDAAVLVEQERTT